MARGGKGGMKMPAKGKAKAMKPADPTATKATGFAAKLAPTMGKMSKMSKMAPMDKPLSSNRRFGPARPGAIRNFRSA